MGVNKRDFEKERQRMVDSQLVVRRISDKAVLDAFRTVPRERFVSPAQRPFAYEDRPLPIANSQTISQPYIVALMTELLELPLGETARVLEIGAGSGYQSAILAAMGHRVTAIERIDELAASAARNLRDAGYDENVQVHVGDGTLGWNPDAPYDGVLVTAAAPDVPEALKRQLRIGGKLVIPRGDRFTQEMLQISKIAEDDFKVKGGIGCRFVPLIGADGFAKKGASS